MELLLAQPHSATPPKGGDFFCPRKSAVSSLDYSALLSSKLFKIIIIAIISEYYHSTGKSNYSNNGIINFMNEKT